MKKERKLGAVLLNQPRYYGMILHGYVIGELLIQISLGIFGYSP
jgi:hypothetical protein